MKVNDILNSIDKDENKLRQLFLSNEISRAEFEETYNLLRSQFYDEKDKISIGTLLDSSVKDLQSMVMSGDISNDTFTYFNFRQLNIDKQRETLNNTLSEFSKINLNSSVQNFGEKINSNKDKINLKEFASKHKKSIKIVVGVLIIGILSIVGVKGYEYYDNNIRVIDYDISTGFELTYSGISGDADAHLSYKGEEIDIEYFEYSDTYDTFKVNNYNDYSPNKVQNINRVLETINFDYDSLNGYSNGDEIIIKILYDQNVAEQSNVNVIGDEIKVTVEGLTELDDLYVELNEQAQSVFENYDILNTSSGTYSDVSFVGNYYKYEELHSIYTANHDGTPVIVDYSGELTDSNELDTEYSELENLSIYSSKQTDGLSDLLLENGIFVDYEVGLTQDVVDQMNNSALSILSDDIDESFDSSDIKEQYIQDNNSYVVIIGPVEYDGFFSADGYRYYKFVFDDLIKNADGKYYFESEDYYDYDNITEDQTYSDCEFNKDNNDSASELVILEK